MPEIFAEEDEELNTLRTKALLVGAKAQLFPLPSDNNKPQWAFVNLQRHPMFKLIGSAFAVFYYTEKEALERGIALMSAGVAYRK